MAPLMSCGAAGGRAGDCGVRCDVRLRAGGEPTAVTEITCGSSCDSASSKTFSVDDLRASRFICVPLTRWTIQSIGSSSTD